MKKNRATAAELLERLQADQEWTEARDAREALRLQRLEAQRVAEKPILEDLKAAGFEVASVFDLIVAGRPYPTAIPILTRHLEKPYPADVRGVLAKVLAVPEARAYWLQIVSEYKKEPPGWTKDTFADTLSVLADEAKLQELIQLAQDPGNGPSRIMFLERLEKAASKQALATVEHLRDDPDLCKEVKFLLRKRQRRVQD